MIYFHNACHKDKITLKGKRHVVTMNRTVWEVKQAESQSRHQEGQVGLDITQLEKNHFFNRNVPFTHIVISVSNAVFN